MPRRTDNQYFKLEHGLVLLAWFNNLLGYSKNHDLLKNTRDVSEGFDAFGQSYILNHLKSRSDKIKIPLDDLERYDSNIFSHLEKINASRIKPVVFRYYQHLALLYTEIFLDWYFNNRKEMLKELNEFVRERNSQKSAGEPEDPYFEEKDMTKLAFWMATGSGKTFVMHINYLQYMNYNNQTLDNVLLITPNEGLSMQHIKDMEASGIPCRKFTFQDSLDDGNKVKVIEITKLVKEKQGEGVSVPVETFEGNNLIFVDEGHKGSGGEAWREYRENLGETGFTFEYSATFGQALDAARIDELTKEYSKAIIFNYSYRYFHEDGFGKDFFVLNLEKEKTKKETTKNETHTLLLGNLLSFFEQQKLFHDKEDLLKTYNLEPPLWIFVGGTVQKSKQRRSDILTVVRFLSHFLSDKPWAMESLSKLLEGKSGLNVDGEDLFKDRFGYIKNHYIDPEIIYEEILLNIFHSKAGGLLHLANLQSSYGEIGLKVGSTGAYFGSIYIGDSSEFRKLVQEEEQSVILEDDAISESLFERVNDPNSHVNILVGARRFIEGWNSWRVSSMGLLNIGRGEGPAIIQLFGRGVRLKGKDFLLKRSSALDGSHPEHIRILETLNIFAVRADYMVKFQEHLEKEGVEIEGNVEMNLPIKTNHDFIEKDLTLPQLPQDRDFVREETILLEAEPSTKVAVDMSSKVQAMQSGDKGFITVSVQTGKECTLSGHMDLIDWEKIHLDLLAHKQQRGYHNMVIRPDIPREIIGRELYFLEADESILEPESFSDTFLLQDIALSILRRYVDNYYRLKKEKWESDNLSPIPLSKESELFQDYTIYIPRSEKKLIDTVQEFISEGERLYKEDLDIPPNVYFDRHLYQPLLVQRKEEIKSSPAGLNESEEKFVKDLKAYCRENINILKDKEIFLLRNLSRGRGIGFFELRGFYPDFILWIKTKKHQRIIFIEPHGMLQARAYQRDEKARLHEKLAEETQRIERETGRNDFSMDSYIISPTPFDRLCDHYDSGDWEKEDFARAHILFFDKDRKYLDVIFRN